MKSVICLTLVLFACIGNPAFATEGNNSIPVVRGDECLVTIDRIDNGLDVIDYQSFVEAYWSRKLREAEENGFPFLNREQLEKRKAEETKKSRDYMIWRRGSGLNEVLIEFSNLKTSEIILKPVKLRNGDESSADHYWPKERLWSKVEISWEKETDAIGVQWSFAKLSEEGIPQYAGQEFRYLGKMTCSSANQAEDNALGKADEVGPPLTNGEKNALRVSVQNCWNVGSLSAEALRTTVVVGFQMDEDARPVASSMEILKTSGGNDAAARQAYEAARRAIIRCGLNGYDLPKEKHEHWREIKLSFNPERMQIK